MWRFVLAFSVLCVSQNYASTVTISVYYESLCSDSVKFFKEQLGITHDSFEGKVEVDLIPFGKANFTKEDGNYTFTCQHGELECHGNKVHSCALKLGTGSNGTQFVMCAMNSSDASDDKNLKKVSVRQEVIIFRDFFFIYLKIYFPQLKKRNKTIQLTLPQLV
nr:GILT-like protein 1 [Leptinotarsa decemlineata]